MIMVRVTLAWRCTHPGGDSVTTLRKAAVCLVAAVMTSGFLAFSPTMASAQQFLFPASACFVSAAPRDVVFRVFGNGGELQAELSCGDFTYGVIHIDADHEIKADGSDDDNVSACMLTIMSFGQEVPAATGNRAYRITRQSGGGTATIVVRDSDLQVVSMFTSDSNNWAACANYTPGA